jgi:hypothetical protein
VKRPEGPTPWKGHESSRPVFHYNREEREATRQRIWEPPIGGFFRRNRGLTLTIIDLVIVLMLFVIVMFVVVPLQSRGRIDGYRLTGEVVHFDDELLVLLTVADTAGESRDAIPADNVVTLVVAGSEALDLVPEQGGSRTIRLRIPIEDAVSELNRSDLPVTVRIGDDERTLRIPVSGEPLPAANSRR